MRKFMQVIGLGVLLGGLLGCDMAEQSAQKLAEKAGQAVQDVGREAVGETLKEFNKQVDEVQQSANEWLGKPAEGAQQNAPQQGEQPEAEQAGEAAKRTEA